MKTTICKCNNCGDLYIDTNPQVNQREYTIEDNSMESLITIKEEHTNNTIIDETYFQGCPICKTDAFLIDVNEDIEEDYSHTLESIEIWKYKIK